MGGRDTTCLNINPSINLTECDLLDPSRQTQTTMGRKIYVVKVKKIDTFCDLDESVMDSKVLTGRERGGKGGTHSRWAHTQGTFS